MNNPTNLGFYSQVLLFKNLVSEEELTFENRTTSEQRVLQCLAHKLDLDYEYSKTSRVVRISRPDVIDASSPPALGGSRGDTSRLGQNNDYAAGTEDHDFMNLDIFQSDFANLSGLFDDVNPLPSDTLSPGRSISSPVSDFTTGSEFSLPSIYNNQSDLFPITPPSRTRLLSPDTREVIPAKRKASDRPVSPPIHHGPCESFKLGKCQAGAACLCSHDIRGSHPLLEPPAIGNYPYDPKVRKTSKDHTPNLEDRKKAKAHRCKSCRIHKKRCSGERPQCTFCQKHRIECCYPDPSPKQHDIVSPGILGMLPSLRHDPPTHLEPPPLARNRYYPQINTSKNTTHRGYWSQDPERSSLQLLTSDDEDNGNSVDFANITTPVFNSRSVRSRSSSIISTSSNDKFRRFTSILNGHPSVHSSAASGYQEIVFDSNSVYSEASVGSGRRGPLSEWAKAGMNAVKKVGACWRCKYLRKTCDTENPCAQCAKGCKEKWENVGCNRGAFQAELPLNKLCLRNYFPTNVEKVELGVARKAQKEATGRRDTWVSDEDDLPSRLRLTHIADVQSPQSPQVEGSSPKKTSTAENPRDGLDADKAEYQAKLTSTPAVVRSQSSSPEQLTEIRNLFLEELSVALGERELNPGRLNPLKQCILSILWEMIECPSSRFILEENGGLENLACLLAPAAIYQARLETDQLIAQSLICLRSCLEAMRAESSGSLAPCAHHMCNDLKWEGCKVGYIATVNMHLSRYFDELSRVFFDKTNIRQKSLWWPSAFYSFCIQSFVRKALLQLTADCAVVPWGVVYQQNKSYINTPLRLFIASSGNYDPLTQTPPFNKSSVPSGEDYIQARRAVHRDSWDSQGIDSSAAYLERLFDMGETQIEI